jgi:hypothetical protein
MTTIISHDGKHIFHGQFVRWVDNHGGFEFHSPSSQHNYCNVDYWKIIFDHNPIIPIGKFTVDRKE